jgi:hypothetical protein
MANNWSEFRQNFILAWTDAWGRLFVRSLLISALMVNVLNWFGAGLLFRNLAQDSTVLHYNVNFGIDLIGTRGQIFLNPLLGLIFLLLNLVLILLLTKNKHFKFLAHILLNAALVANILLLLAQMAVYLINFR